MEVALGKASAQSGVGMTAKPKTIEERVAALEGRVEMLSQAFLLAQDAGKESRPEENLTTYDDHNKDGIPVGINLIGITKGCPFVLTVQHDTYDVGITSYPTLSAAAQGVSGCRRSGWTFWKLPDGTTVKDAFRSTRK